uniref:Uncharacterized protein n=1 Tax=Glossina austeni TaxID=7395 RepID=A0A1A9VMV4_GLOAU
MLQTEQPNLSLPTLGGGYAVDTGIESLLNEENDAIWKFQKPAVLIENDLRDYVENTCLVGDGAEKWRKMGQKACADLMPTITSSKLGRIAEYETIGAILNNVADSFYCLKCNSSPHN